MNIMLAGIFGGWEIALIFGVVLILFGAKRLPDLAKGLGTGIREFKKASREVTAEIQNAAAEPPKPKTPVVSQRPPPAVVAQTPAPPQA